MKYSFILVTDSPEGLPEITCLATTNASGAALAIMEAIKVVSTQPAVPPVPSTSAPQTPFYLGHLPTTCKSSN